MFSGFQRSISLPRLIHVILFIFICTAAVFADENLLFQCLKITNNFEHLNLESLVRI